MPAAHLTRGRETCWPRGSRVCAERRRGRAGLLCPEATELAPHPGFCPLVPPHLPALPDGTGHSKPLPSLSLAVGPPLLIPLYFQYQSLRPPPPGPHVPGSGSECSSGDRRRTGLVLAGSKHLILCRPLLLLPSIIPSVRVFSNESVLYIRWPKYWCFIEGREEPRPGAPGGKAQHEGHFWCLRLSQNNRAIPSTPPPAQATMLEWV